MYTITTAKVLLLLNVIGTHFAGGFATLLGMCIVDAYLAYKFERETQLLISIVLL